MAEPTLSSRQRDILALIETEGAQYIEDLARRHEVTTQTVRRDINALCDLGYARRFHGGVDMPVEARNISANARAQLNAGPKRAIARRIAEEIGDGATVFLGIGTSVLFVAEALREHSRLTIITNNIDAALSLSEATHLEVHLTGGLMRHNDRDVVGADVIKFFEKFYATYAVVGAGGLSPAHGIMDFSYSEAQITNAILENAQTRFLAADSSKWSRSAAVRVAPFSKLACFFTDRAPNNVGAREALKESGIDMVLCAEEI